MTNSISNRTWSDERKARAVARYARKRADGTWEKKREERFWSKVDRKGPDECWSWTGAKTPQGYGMFCMEKGITHPSSRVAMMMSGHDVEGLVVVHDCCNVDCCNPAHLRLTSMAGAFHYAVKRRGPRVVTPEQRKKHSEFMKNVDRSTWNMARPKPSAETKKKISEALTGRKKTVAQRLAQSIRQTGKKHKKHKPHVRQQKKDV